MTGTDAADCPRREIISDGCLANGEHWVLIYDDGEQTYELFNAETGQPADANDIVECDETGRNTTVEQRHFFATPWSSQAAINGLGTLTSWQVYAEKLPVTIFVNGVSVAMELHEVIGASAQDNRILNDSVTVVLGAGGEAHLTSVRRAA